MTRGTSIPDELVLATRLELALADRGELSDLIDRRIAEATRLDGVLLVLTTPLDMPVDEISSCLETLSGVSESQAAAMRVVLVDALVTQGRVSIERAVDYLAARAAQKLPSPLDADCGALDDMVWMAKHETYGTLADVRTRLHEIADACATLFDDAVAR